MRLLIVRRVSMMCEPETGNRSRGGWAEEIARPTLGSRAPHSDILLVNKHACIDEFFQDRNITTQVLMRLSKEERSRHCLPAETRHPSKPLPARSPCVLLYRFNHAQFCAKIQRCPNTARLAASPHALVCMLEEDGIRIEADDLPRRTDALAEQIRYAFGAASQIEAAPSPSDTDLLQHDSGVRCERGALDMQPLDLASAPLDRVVPLCWFSHRDWAG